MAGRRLVVVCAIMMLVVLAGCGKKTAKETSGDTQPPPVSGLPGVNLPNKKDKKEPQSTDFDILVSDMKMHAGKLKTDTSSGGYETLKRLTDNIKPDHPRRAEVYKALTETAGKVSSVDRDQYLYWAVKYAGKENAAELLTIASKEYSNPGVCEGAFARLVEFKDPSTFEPIAALLTDFVGKLRLESAKALRGIGAPAEKAVQPYAGPTRPDGKSNDFVLRTVAVQILGDIGTADSLPLLKSLFNDKATTVAELAKKAAEEIQARAK